MSRIGRLLPPFAAGRRTYSFFSSKPGGGRYFNSAKPAKVIATPSSASSPSTSASQSQSTAGSSTASNAPDGSVADELQSATKAGPEQLAENSPIVPSPDAHALAPALSPPHPSLKPHELTLHHFFSLHRPYLLINQPTSALFESAPPPKTAASSTTPPASLGTIDDPPVASPEADADSARQLGRALVMNRVGNAVDWEHALSRLGLQEMKDPVPPVPAGLSLDSTKRKRRKKMKKHKCVVLFNLIFNSVLRMYAIKAEEEAKGMQISRVLHS